jgi:hypothetical protein
MLLAACEAARPAGDRAALAWALHHLGTRPYVRSDERAALADLREALALRCDLRDARGVAPENEARFPEMSTERR